MHIGKKIRPFRQQKIYKQQASRANLVSFLKQRKISFEFLEKPETMHAEEASKVTGIPLQNFAKTVFLVNEQNKPFVVVLRADCTINRHSLQAITGFKAIQTASKEIAEKTSGFPIGGIPPIGHRTTLPTFIDESLLSLKEFWCGGGSRTKLVKLQTQEVLNNSNGKISKFSQKPA